jgi:DNA-binding LacI/PurR family transcriptional regulator
MNDRRRRRFRSGVWGHHLPARAPGEGRPDRRQRPFAGPGGGSATLIFVNNRRAAPAAPRAAGFPGGDGMAAPPGRPEPGAGGATARARRAATLKEVAALAGVSTATVARVLHNNGHVADATRRAVERAVRDSGYRPNILARGLRTRRTFTLGHVLQTTALNPFFAGVAIGAEQEAERHGCGVLVFNTERDPDRERRGVETLIQRRVDAIIFTTPSADRNVELAVEAGIPVVQVERVGPTPTLTVTVDNHVGARAAVEHLLALGHRRIAFLGVDPASPAESLGGVPSRMAARRAVERERLAGYLDALRAAGVEPPPLLVALGPTYYSTDHARATVGPWLALPPGERPTAVFAACDILAAGVLQEVHARRLRVPDDVSLVGFDDTYAPYLAPPLTTVAQPVLDLGRAATRLAMAALRAGDGADPLRSERLVTRLVVRASTGPPPR